MSSNIIIYPKLLGKGAFGEVSLGLHRSTKRLVAVKKESKDKQGGRVLKHEYNILRYIGRPAIGLWEDLNYCYMAIPLMGPSLDKINLQTKFSLGFCSYIGIQMLDAIEICHSKGVLHRDIKPANFLVNYNIPHKTIQLVDFGLSKKYLDGTGNHIPYITGVPRVGSLRYMSKNVHKSIEASRRDDLYSIAYVIIFLYVGNLPWKGVIQNLTIAEKHKAVLEVKEKFTNRRLAKKNICAECHFKNNAQCPCFVNMVKMLDYIDSLTFNDNPDYNRLKSYLQETIIHTGGDMLSPLTPWHN